MTEQLHTQEKARSFSGAELAAIVSGVAAYGYALGAVYMRAYWGSFGIDPFQHGSTADIAIAGFSAIAVFAVMLLLAAWFGRILAETLSQFEKGQRILGTGLLVTVPVLAVVAIVSGYGWIILGMIGVIAVTLMFLFTPSLPMYLRWPPTAMMIGMLTVYLPFAAHGQAKARAEAAWDIDTGWVVDRSRSAIDLELLNDAKVAGRLGEHMILLEPASQAVIFLPTGPQLQLVTVPHDLAKERTAGNRLKRASGRKSEEAQGNNQENNQEGEPDAL